MHDHGIVLEDRMPASEELHEIVKMLDEEGYGALVEARFVQVLDEVDDI
jgi:hypothetical protein